MHRKRLLVFLPAALLLLLLRPAQALSGASAHDDDDQPIRRAAPQPKPKASMQNQGSQGGILTAMLANKAFHDTIKAEILEVLRTKEGQDLLAQIVKKEIDKQK